MAKQPTRLLDSKILDTRGFRPEIQGLRALALFLVVTYHIWFGTVSGGVDVFLFISAFLLSLSTLRRINEGSPLALVKYWLHVFQRLLPAATVVIGATVVASFFFLSPSRLLSIVQDSLAALTYWLNWRLAFNSVDYYTQDAAGKTPFQHFWSLSLQGQIFILWPLLFALVWLLARRFRFNLMASALLVFGSIFVASLTFSILETQRNQAFAYFDTRTRLWEFAAGTLLALVIFKWRPPQWARIPMGWLGVAGLISCGFVLPVEQAFPGYLALWPLASAALVILAGRTGSPFAVDAILASKPLLKLGEISYALYLVHWPVFIIYSTYTGQDYLDALTGTLMILACMVLAWLIHTFVEVPLRKPTRATPRARHSRRVLRRPSAFSPQNWVNFVKPLAIIGACIIFVGAPLLGTRVHLDQRNVELAGLASEAGSRNFPGALGLGNEPARYNYPPIPATDPLAQYDGLEQGSCSGIFSVKKAELAYACGVAQYGHDDAPRILLMGGSHVGQSVAFYRKLAEEQKMNLIDMHIGGCRLPLKAEPEPTEACITYNKNIVAEALAQKPDFVGLMLTQTDPATKQEILVPGVEEVIKKLTSAGIKVIGLRDNPRWTQDMYTCAQMNPENPDSCGAPVGDKLAPKNPAAELIAGNKNLYSLDFTPQLCPDGYCEAVIGNVLVYMDDNHISKAYASTLSDAALDQLEKQNWLADLKPRAVSQG